MQLIVNIGQLREAVNQASYTLDTKAASLGSFLYLIARQGKGEEKSRLYIYSSNLGLARTLLKIDAEVTKAGVALIPPKLLQAIIVSLPAEDDISLTLSASGSKLQVKYEQVKSEIAVHADSAKADEVLSTFQFNAQPDSTVSAATLVEAINRTLFCTASGSNVVSEGPWLSNVHLETIDNALVATATNRIMAGKCEIHDTLVTPGHSWGVHRDALVALKAVLSKRKDQEVTITSATSKAGSVNEVLFRFQDVILGIRQLSKPYPKAVAKIFTVPDANFQATVDKKALQAVFSRLNAFAEGGSFIISFAADKVRLATRGYSSEFQEVVKRQETTDVAGNVTIGLAVADVVNVLQVMQAENVVIRYSNDAEHVHFQEGEGPFRYVLSPVNVDWAKGKAAA